MAPNADSPHSRLIEARERLRNLLKESRDTLEAANTKPLPEYYFQFTPAPRNVTVTVRKYNPKGENEDPTFLPIIAESRHRRTLRSCVTVIEITSTDEDDEEIIEESKEKIEPTVSTPADKTEEKNTGQKLMGQTKK